MSLPRILLVDDQPASLLVLEAVLGDLEVTLVPASSGEEALRHGLAGEFAAVVLDVQMPGMDGFEVARRLREGPRSRTTPVIFLTVGETPEFTVEQAYALGAVDYLIKPVIPAVLRAKVAFFVGYFQQTRALQEAERRNDAVRRAREQEEHLNSVFDAAAEGIYVVGVGGRCTYMNPAGAAMLGYRPDEVIGHGLHAWIHHHRSDGSAYAVDECPIDRAARDGTRARVDDDVFWRRDGAAVPVVYAASPMLVDGVPAGAVVTFSDITERKRAEAALRASEERFRFLDTLGEATRSATDANTILAITARLLGERLGCTRIAYADVDADGDRFTIRHDWTAPGATSTVGVYSLDRFGPRAAGELRGNRPLVVADVAELSADGAATFGALGIAAIVCCPLVKRDRLVAMMAAHQATPRAWTEAEVALVEEVVERSWAHIERVRDAAALREKDERLTLLVENIRDYAVIITDLAGKVIEWQGGAERITGFTPAEAVGRLGDLLFTPEDRAAGRPAEEMRRAARDGRAEDRRCHLRKDGTRFFADGVMTALYDDADRLRGYGKVFKDATGEQRAEASRIHHTDQLKRLADVSSRLNAVLDLESVLGLVTEEGRVLIGAHQAVTSLGSEAHATSFSAQLRSDARAVSAADRAAMFRDVATGARSIRMTHAQLTTHARWAALREAAESHPAMRGLLAAPIVGRGGEVLGVIQLSDRYADEFSEDDEAILVQLAQMAAVAVENTRLYQALRDADRRKDEFLAMLAHELRNPLAPMQNALAVLDRAGEHDEHSLRLRGVIGRQIDHLTRLVDDLLDVARITSGKVALQREAVELAGVVALAVETSRPLIDAKRHALVVEVDPDPVWLDADPVRLAQVIANLLNNAAKYTDVGGRIRVVAGRDGDEAVVRVEDDGLGLLPEMLPRVFDLFTQASAGIARSAGGLGIGLTLVRKLVELHGGDVRVTSGGLGRGSEFEVRLPATRAHTSEPGDPSATAGDVRRRVLVVDDNHDVLDTMSMLLELYGHTVATAADGVRAIEVARAFRPEVMFLDLGLPGRDGYAVARILREEFPRGTLRLVALSGYGQAEDRRRTQEAGFDQHLVKPADPEAIRLACLAPLDPR